MIVAVLVLLVLSILQGGKIMGAMDDLKREIAELKASVAALAERLKDNPTEAEIAAVAAELNEIGGQVDTMDPATPPPGP